MKRSTQRKGDTAAARAIFVFTELGYDVAVPLTESAPYDLIVDTGDQLVRVQVKYTSRSEVDLRNVHHTAKQRVVKKYERGAFDWLFVYWPAHGDYLIKTSLAGRCSIRMQDDFRLESGMDEESGLNPPDRSNPAVPEFDSLSNR